MASNYYFLTPSFLPPSRYGELIIRVILSGYTVNLKVLQRDASLLRFFHGFVITTPQIIIHLYAITVATDSTHPDTNDYRVSAQVLFALGACVISLCYSVATYITSDRLTSATRRVILPAHLALMGWYVCIVVPRILSFTLFTHAFGYFVVIFLFSHWVLSVLGILHQKGRFCADYAQQPKKQRWGLEILFSLFAACLYQFVYFSLKEGTTRYAVSVYIVITLIENVIMVSLFFSEYSTLWYAPASVAVVVGLFLLGVLLLLVYYLVLHPDKTDAWYWVGFPKRCFHVPLKGKSYRPHNIEISQPTLVNMNGQATNLQSRMSGLQPLTSILARGKPTGQMQLTAPPRIIESGLPRQDADYYKKPRIHAPPSRLSSERHSQTSQPNSVRVLHTQSPSSNFSSEPVSTSEANRIQLLTIPANASLTSSGHTNSDDVDAPGTATETIPLVDPYTQMPLQQSMDLHMDNQIESTFQVLSVDVPNSNTGANANSSNANRHHDGDIDSPLMSPYDTLDKARKDVVTLKETEMILEENELLEEGRVSVSPPNLPTPDFTDQSLLPGQPNHQLHDQQSDLHHQLHEKQRPEVPQLPMTPQQNIPPHPPVPPLIQPSLTPVQNSTKPPQSQPTSQLSMFQDIPAKRDYHTQPSKLEQHYFPEPASSSTPNISRGSKNSVGVQNSDENPPRGQKDLVMTHSSLPLNEEINSVTQGPPSHHLHQNGIPPRQGVNPPNYSPQQPHGPHQRSPNTQRGGRGRGRGGGGNRNQKKERKGSQSYYAYTSSSNPPVKPNTVRPHSFHAPQATLENRQKLFGRTLPAGMVAPGNPAVQLSWQQQRSTMPARITVPPSLVQKSRWPSDRSRTSVQIQTDPAGGQTPIRPRSYSEGAMLDSQFPSQERRKSNPHGPPDPQNMAPQYSPHFLGRSPGAPRRGQQSYYAPSDRTQVLNLTWTSPRLHHDPAISGQAHLLSKTVGSYGNSTSSESSPQSFHKGLSNGKMHRGTGNFNPQRKFSKNKLGEGGQYSLSPGGARKLSTNHSPGKTNPMLYIPAQDSHTSRV